MENHSKNSSWTQSAANKCWQLIQSAQTITLLTHKNPDGDGISACAAFDVVLRDMGKTVEAIYPSKPAFELLFHAQQYAIAQHSQIPDLIIALDTATKERLHFPDSFNDIPLINIDHHTSNTNFGTYNFIDPKAASACEVLYELLTYWDKKSIAVSVAEPLLYGILYDTQTFHTQNTSAKTLRIAADLMDTGANLFALKTHLLSHKNTEIISLWSQLLNRIEITDNKKAALASITMQDLQDRNLTLSSLGGFVNFLSEISGIDVVALLYEQPDSTIKISLRSKEADVNKVAAHFGGGGHIHASGATAEGELETAKNALKKILEAL